ncbi:MAG: 5'-nucleotidase [Bacillota bacterium]
MGYCLKDCLVIGVSSRALFDLSFENGIFETEGLLPYKRYQIEHENDVLKPGPGFAIVKSLLNLNGPGERKRVEVLIMSRNSADTSLRIFNSIEHYGLNITRAVLSGGAALAPYLSAFGADLFLSAYPDDVQKAIDSNIAAGILCTDGIPAYPERDIDELRIAFDGDAVLFSDESERIFKEQGLEAFEHNERCNADNPLPEGPFARFLKTLANIQKEFEGTDRKPIRTALVTARHAPAHERVVRTLRAWDVRVDESFFLGGIDKKEVLAAFGAHIFFDDQATHTESASKVVPAARVPIKTNRCRQE